MKDVSENCEKMCLGVLLRQALIRPQVSFYCSSWNLFEMLCGNTRAASVHHTPGKVCKATETGLPSAPIPFPSLRLCPRV